MNIIFLSIGGLGDLNSNAVYPDLLRYFRDKGHKVYVVCQREKRSGLPTEMNVEYDINVLRVQTGNITKSGLFEKGVATLRIGSLFIDAIKKHFNNIKFDLVLYTTPPITLARVVEYLKDRDNAYCYLMLKDIFPQNAIDIGMMKQSVLMSPIVWYFKRKEKHLYRVSDHIGCMSNANVNYLKKNHPYLDSKIITVCPNTIDPIENTQVSKVNLRERFDLPLDKSILIYGGNFGKPQNVDYIIDCMKSQEEKHNIHFVMCGSGTDFYKIREYAHHVSNEFLTVMDALGNHEYHQLLDACDIGLIFLDHRFTIPNYPSRLLDYMNHELPVIAATDINTDIKETILDGGFGWWCESSGVSNFEKIVDVAFKFDVDLKMMGKQGKDYLKNHFHTRIAYDAIIEAYQNRD